VRSYPAKLLLFGEHTVLVGSSSLAIPLPHYTMSWVEKSGDHPSWLEAYTKYLIEKCSDIIDTDHLQAWIQEHTIESNIPIGYGLGSSGALTAAIYDICGSDTDHNDYAGHQSQMARMESFFHGQSSGFDPLVSYVDHPVLRTKESIKVAASKVSLDLDIALVDSGKPRAGRELIQRFLQAYEKDEAAFAPLIQMNSAISEHVYHGKTSDIFHTIKEISKIQLQLMGFLITPEMKALWEKGLASEDYVMKICGAGGGGYFLCFALDRSLLTEHEQITWLEVT